MAQITEKVDVCVIGAGHAGCEAALACARMGLETVIFTVSVESIALMPCNPNIGGSSKGHLVRELDALGGEMGKNIDHTFIQSKMLKANIYMVENVLENMAKVDNIKDFRRYFISSLYNEVLTYHFNEGCESRNIDEQIRRDLGYGIAV